MYNLTKIEDLSLILIIKITDQDNFYRILFPIFLCFHMHG